MLRKKPKPILHLNLCLKDIFGRTHAVYYKTLFSQYFKEPTSVKYRQVFDNMYAI